MRNGTSVFCMCFEHYNSFRDLNTVLGVSSGLFHSIMENAKVFLKFSVPP